MPASWWSGDAQRTRRSGREATNMMPTATITAAIITSTCCAMPTAVMIESIENTMSMTMIWAMIAANACGALCAEFVLVRLLDRGVHLVRRLVDQEDAAGDQDEVASTRRHVRTASTTGAVSPMIQADHQQQQDAEDQRQRQAEPAGRGRPAPGQARHQHRDEDDVVDAEHDLHHGQGREGGPDGGARSEVRASKLLVESMRPDVSSRWRSAKWKPRRRIPRCDKARENFPSRRRPSGETRLAHAA